jgi:hypothetical protein
MLCLAILHNIITGVEGLREFSSNDCGSLDAIGGTQLKKSRMHNLPLCNTTASHIL